MTKFTLLVVICAILKSVFRNVIMQTNRSILHLIKTEIPQISRRFIIFQKKISQI